jgi:hypothetical protein
MSRLAVERGIERYVDELIDVAAEEFSVAAALDSGVRGPGGVVVDRLLDRRGALQRHVVRPELQATRRDVLAGFGVVVDAAAAGDSADERATELLARDGFWAAVRDDVSDDRRAAVRERLLGRYRLLVDAAAPPVRAEADEFWPAVRESLDLDAALELLEAALSFTDPVVEHRDAFAFTASFDPGAVLRLGPLGSGLPTVTVEYTDEAIRTMRRAERVVTERARREARRAFGAE